MGFKNDKMKASELVNKIFDSWMNNESIDCDTPTGLRIMNVDNMNVGDKITNSTRWDDGTDTGEELNGACTIMLQLIDTMITVDNVKSAIQRILSYHGCGDTLVMVKGYSFEGGEDNGEIVISEPEIGEIICDMSELARLKKEDFLCE